MSPTEGPDEVSNAPDSPPDSPQSQTCENHLWQEMLFPASPPPYTESTNEAPPGLENTIHEIPEEEGYDCLLRLCRTFEQDGFNLETPDDDKEN